MKMVTPSSIGGMKVAMAWPNMWLRGSRFRKRSGKKGRPYRAYFRISRSTGTMLASTFACVMRTPFGSAVAPDVKMISARSSRLGRSAASPSAALSKRSGTGASGAGGSCAAPPPSSSSSAQVSTPESGGGRRPSPATTSRAATIRTTRPTRSGDARRSIGTATVRAARQPQKATIHSARFSPHSTTRSPGARPCWRSEAANRRAARPISA